MVEVRPYRIFPLGLASMASSHYKLSPYYAASYYISPDGVKQARFMRKTDRPRPFTHESEDFEYKGIVGSRLLLANAVTDTVPSTCVRRLY